MHEGAGPVCCIPLCPRRALWTRGRPREAPIQRLGPRMRVRANFESARRRPAGGKLTCGSHRIVYAVETDCGNSAAYSACAKASRGGAPSSSNWPGCMRRSGARPRPRGGCTASARHMRRCVLMGFVCAPLARQASFKHGRSPDPPPHSTHKREQRALEPARAPPWPRGP